MKYLNLIPLSLATTFTVTCTLRPLSSLADVIEGITATATSELIGSGFDRAANHAADGSGLNGDSHIPC